MTGYMVQNEADGSLSTLQRISNQTLRCPRDDHFGHCLPEALKMTQLCVISISHALHSSCIHLSGFAYPSLC